MADSPGMLSQNEIDALMASMTAEREAPKEAAPPPPPPSKDDLQVYDFRRPDRFSKEQMRALRGIHETWARRTSISLSAYLRGSVEVNLADIDQGMYVTMAQQLGVQGLYYIIGLPPLPGHFMIYMSLDMAMAIVDRIMGGPGLAFNTSRSLTELEIDLLRVVTDKMLEDLREAWSGTATLQARIDDTSMNLLLVPIALPTDAIVWATFEVRVRGIASNMVLALPYPVLKPITSQLSPYNWMSNAQSALPGNSKAHFHDLQASMKDVKMPVSVLLGSTHITLEELASLQAGDILALDAPCDALCPMLVNGRAKYLGRPGMRRRKLAVQIERILGDQTIPESETQTMSVAGA